MHPAAIVLAVAASVACNLAAPVRPAYSAEAAGDSGETERLLHDSVRPLFAKHCLECHQGAKPKGDLALDKMLEAKAGQQDRELWQKIAEKLRKREMPPEDKPQPSPAERELLIAWYGRRFGEVSCNGPRNPGRVTIRRLNRAEYNNTIRDLTGLDFQGADDFPSDDVGYGFDNIGDVLSLPPILLEKYLAAAEKIVDRAIAEQPASGVLARFEAEAVSQAGPGGVVHDGTARSLISEGELAAEVKLPAAGEYIVRVRGYGDQAGPDPARMTLRLGDQPLGTIDVTAVEAAPAIYEVHAKAEAGQKKLTVRFINDYYKPAEPDPSQRDRNLNIDYFEVAGPLEAAPGAVDPRKIMICQPSTEKPSSENARECAKQIIGRFARRAFRRPIKPEELDRLVKFVDVAAAEGDGFEQGVKLALQAVLVSPHFLFRIELDPDDPSSVRTLDEHELAARLSYFLWSSMPDEELFGLADRHELRQGGNLQKQVRRMLKDAKSRTLAENFAGQWLQLRNLKTVSPDPKRFPRFNDGLRKSMRTETEMFFAAVLEEDLSVLDFLDADFTFLNQRLAQHYGISGIYGDKFRRVKLPGNQRGGVLTHASVLTVTSNPTRTSPVKRGKWVLENLLGTPPPPPPPGVPELDDAGGSEKSVSLRERLELHRSKAECAVCHSRMDPLGFGLENYDAVGIWRVKDGKSPIDATGTLPDGKTFNGPQELKAMLRSRGREFTRCLSEKLLTYALGRGTEYDDRCTVDDLVAAVERGEHKFSSLVLAIVESDAFQKRNGKGVKP